MCSHCQRKIILSISCCYSNLKDTGPMIPCTVNLTLSQSLHNSMWNAWLWWHLMLITAFTRITCAVNYVSCSNIIAWCSCTFLYNILCFNGLFKKIYFKYIECKAIVYNFSCLHAMKAYEKYYALVSFHSWLYTVTHWHSINKKSGLHFKALVLFINAVLVLFITMPYTTDMTHWLYMYLFSSQ